MGVMIDADLYRRLCLDRNVSFSDERLDERVGLQKGTSTTAGPLSGTTRLRYHDPFHIEFEGKMILE